MSKANKLITMVVTLSAFADEFAPDLEMQMNLLAAEGIYHIDLRTVRGKGVLQLTDDEVEAIKKRLDDRGFRIASIASSIANTPITDDFTPQLKPFMRAIQLAHYFGTPYIRIFSFAIPKEADKDSYKDEVVRRMRELTRIAEREGITLLIDNDSFAFVDNGERARDILGTIGSPHLRLTFDPANFIKAPVLPMTDAYPLVAPYIAYVHMKDARLNTGEVVPAGEGDGEIRKLIAALKESHYSGFISVEPKGTPGIAHPDFSLKAVKALKKLLEESGIGWRTTAPPLPIVSCLPQAVPADFLTHWIPLTPLEKMAETEYDVLIVGTGAGGGAVLWRLCEQWQQSGKRIGIIERGGPLLPTQARNLPTMNSSRLLRLFYETSTPLPGSLPDYANARQLFALGGRTLFWNTISPRMSLSETAEWPVSPEELEAYYTIAEEVMNVTQDFTQGSSMTAALLKRLHQLGIPEAKAVPMAADLRSRIYAEPDSDVFFSTMDFLAKALNDRPFDLAVQTRAVEVLTDKGNAAGVKVISPDNKTFTLRAKTVVLSASTFETPRLLLNSGIQGRAIGHYLSNHSPFFAVGTMSRKEFPDPLGTLGILIPGTAASNCQIQLRGPDGYDWHQSFQQVPFADELEILILANGRVESRFENKVTLDPNRKDVNGVPEIRIDYSYSEKDQAVRRQTVAAINRISSALGISLLSQEGQPAILAIPPGDYHHDSGTCRMGDDPSTSATNRYGQIHGVSGLYVADNSVLPSVGTANVTLTTVALALRTADHIIRQE